MRPGVVPRGFREVGGGEVITEYYWSKPQEVFLHPRDVDVWKYKWRLIWDLYFWLPDNYLSRSSVTYYVNASEGDDSVKVVEAIWNPYEVGIPKSVHAFVRKDLEYYIIVYSAMPDYEFGEQVLREWYYLIHVRNGRIIKKGWV